MQCSKITHQVLNPEEYYYCYFSSDKDIQDFAKTCSWFDLNEIEINPPEAVILIHDIESGWFEKVSPGWFKRWAGERAEIYGAVLRQAAQFFG